MASVPSGSPDELPIDVELIKVLASDSRRDILRLLGERRRTLTELADAIGLKKATVLEHLQKLVEADLIKRLDQDERLWVYYELTPRGKRLVRPERTRFFLILGGTAAAALILGAIVAAAMFSGWGGERATSEDAFADAPMGQKTFEETAGATAPPLVWRGLDERAEIRVPGAPSDAVVRLRADDGTGASVPLADGLAVLVADDIDALAPGEYRLALDTSEGEIDLFATTTVRDASVAIFPLAIPQNVSTTLELALAPPHVGAPAAATFAFDGEPVTADAYGTPTRLSVLAAGDEATLQVGRLWSAELLAVPQISLSFVADNGSLAVHVAENGAPLAGARLALDGAVIGATNETGALATAPFAAGDHALRILAADGREQERGIRALEDGTVGELPPALRIDAYDARLGSVTGMRLRADVFNDGPAEQIVTIAARENGALLASALVRVPAHGRAETLLEAPLAQPGVVQVSAHAARAAGSVAYASAGAWESSLTDADGAAAPGAPAAPAYATRGALASQADASTTLVFAMPTATSAAAEQLSPSEAPRVPFVEPVVALALVALAALALRRRRS